MSLDIPVPPQRRDVLMYGGLDCACAEKCKRTTMLTYGLVLLAYVPMTISQSIYGPCLGSIGELRVCCSRLACEFGLYQTKSGQIPRCWRSPEAAPGTCWPTLSSLVLSNARVPWPKSALNRSWAISEWTLEILSARLVSWRMLTWAAQMQGWSLCRDIPQAEGGFGILYQRTLVKPQRGIESSHQGPND